MTSSVPIYESDVFDYTFATTTITMAVLPMPPIGIGAIDMGAPRDVNFPWQYLVGIMVVTIYDYRL